MLIFLVFAWHSLANFRHARGRSLTVIQGIDNNRQRQHKGDEMSQRRVRWKAIGLALLFAAMFGIPVWVWVSVIGALFAAVVGGLIGGILGAQLGNRAVTTKESENQSTVDMVSLIEHLFGLNQDVIFAAVGDDVRSRVETLIDQLRTLFENLSYNQQDDQHRRIAKEYERVVRDYLTRTIKGYIILSIDGRASVKDNVLSALKQISDDVDKTLSLLTLNQQTDLDLHLMEMQVHYGYINQD